MKTSIGFLILVGAFVPAALLLALRIYFNSHPPDSSEAGARDLQRGLKLGAISAAALPLLFILANFRPISAGWANIPYVICAFAGNALNLTAITDCLRERSGESLFAALLVLGVQLVWLFCLFAAFMSAR
jgi:hypothetical protein